MNDKWKFLGSKTAYTDPILKVEHREYYYKDADASMPFTLVHMANWASIVALTDDGKVVCVRQFRIGMDDYTIEFPGGAVENGEDHADAAARELEEETGYKCRSIRKIGEMSPNPAFMKNRCHVYLAEGCTPTGKMNPDQFEDIEPVEYSIDEVKGLIAEGRLNHSIVLAAWAIYLNKA